LINGVMTGVTAGAMGFMGASAFIAGLRAAAFLAGFFLPEAFFLEVFFAAFLEDFFELFFELFLEDFFFDAFFFEVFFFATRFFEDFLEDFFFAAFLVVFFFAAFFFAAMVKLLSMLDRLYCVRALRLRTTKRPHYASNEIGDRILFATM
jgi:hypothetical protein